MTKTLQKLVELTIETPEKIKALESDIEKARSDIESIQGEISEIGTQISELIPQETSLDSQLIDLEDKFKKKMNIIKWISTIVAIVDMILIISFHSYIGTPLAFLVAGATSIILGIPAIAIQTLDENNLLNEFCSNHLYKHNLEYKGLHDKATSLETQRQELRTKENELNNSGMAKLEIINAKERKIQNLLEELKQARTRYGIECFDNLTKTNPEMIPEDTVQEIEAAFVKYKI